MSTSQCAQYDIYAPNSNSTHDNGSQASSFFDSTVEQAAQDDTLAYAHMDIDEIYKHSGSTSDGIANVGKEFSTGEGQRLQAENDYRNSNSNSSSLDSRLPPRTCDYDSTLDSSDQNQLLHHHLFSGPNQLSDYGYYGFQVESQHLQGYQQPSKSGDPVLSSSHHIFAPSANPGPDNQAFSVDFSEFSDQMRQYQRAAMASQNQDGNGSPAPYFQQPAARQSATPSLKQSHTYPLHQRNKLQHQWRSSPSSIGELKSRWLGQYEQGGQTTDNDAAGGHHPANSNFSQHQIDFPKALWDASDVSREPGMIAEQRQVGLVMPPVPIPAQDQHVLYHSSSLSPSTQYSQGPPAMPLSLHTLTSNASEGAASQFESSTVQQAHNGHSNIDTYQEPNVALLSSRETEASSNHFAHPSSQTQQHSRPLSYRVQSFSSLSNQTEASAGGSAGRAPSGWSNLSQYPGRTVPPIQIPRFSQDSNGIDHERASLSSAGSSIGGHSSSHFVISPMTGTPPQSPTRMDYTALYTHQSASQSGSTTGKRLYECKICSRKFPRPSALVVHERIHSGDKPFVCEVCDRTFTVASNLRRHQKIHAKQLKQASMSAQAAESIGPSTVRAKPQRSKPYPSSSSGQQQDKDSQESELSAEIDDGHEYGSSEGSISSLSALQPVAGPSRTLPDLANIMDWTQNVGSHSPSDPLPGD